MPYWFHQIKFSRYQIEIGSPPEEPIRVHDELGHHLHSCNMTFSIVTLQVLHEIPADFGCHKAPSPDVGTKWEMVILYQGPFHHETCQESLFFIYFGILQCHNCMMKNKIHACRSMRFGYNVPFQTWHQPIGILPFHASLSMHHHCASPVVL